MNKQSPLRLFFNLVLTALAVISVISAGLISVKGFRANKIPEIYSNSQIIKLVKQDNSDFSFTNDEDWDISTSVAEDSKSFLANINITQEHTLCKKQYNVQVLYKLEDGKWNSEYKSDGIEFVKNVWTFENTVWSARTEDGVIYSVSFTAGPDAEIRIVEADGEVDNTKIEAANKNTTLAAETESSSDSKCHLNESEDGESYTGIFEFAGDKSIALTVTEEHVKIDPGDETGELFLNRE